MKSNKEMFMREQLGVITKTDNHCFDVGAVSRLCEFYVNSKGMSSPDKMFVVIDPCGGGASALAVVSGFMNGDMLVVRYFAYALNTVSKKALRGTSWLLCDPE